MSNIYIQEPPTNGKVMLLTTVGDIDIELWSKEAPKACRNFIQLCMEGYYDGTIFHRVVKDFIVQGGDPTGTGNGGESVYGTPFKDEIHTRLRFVRRGLVAMANSGPNDNGSQFFFTMGPTQELQGKHTVFGKAFQYNAFLDDFQFQGRKGSAAGCFNAALPLSIMKTKAGAGGTSCFLSILNIKPPELQKKVTGNTVYNMLKLQECDVDQNERPTFPNKIKKTQILSNPFDDIEPRETDKNKIDQGGDQNKSKSKATKNFSLLSFGEEAEEDQEEVAMATMDLKGKSKSSHDLIDDPKLSSVPAVDMKSDSSKKEKRRESYDDKGDEEDDDDDSSASSDEENKSKLKEDIRKKLGETDSKRSTGKQTEKELPKKMSRSEELRREVHELKKELKRKREEKSADKSKDNIKESQPENDVVAAYKAEKQKYVNIKKQQSKKGSGREEMTLAMLSKFQTKLRSASLLGGNYDDDDEDEEKETEEGEKQEEEDDVGDLSWMRHKLQFDDDRKRKVIDANITDMDRYEIFDPRNPLTKRRREASKQAMKDKR